MGIFLAMKDYN